MGIIEMSVRGGIIISVIFILRSLRLSRVPKSVTVILWELALLSLSLPIRFIPKAVGGAGESGARVFDYYYPQTPELSDFTPPEATETAAHSFSLLKIIWLAGAFALGIFFLISYIKCKKSFRSACECRDGFILQWLKDHAIRRTVTVKLSDYVSTPLTYGILRPVILLPKNLNIQTNEQLNYILLHELYHIRRFDGLLKLWMNTVLCFHWFNPLVWLMRSLLIRDIELRCDESVLKELGEDGRKDYAMTVIGLSEQRSGFLNIGSGFSKDAVTERIEAIMKMKKKICIPIIISVIVIMTVTVAIASAVSAMSGYSSETAIAIDGGNSQYLKNGELIIIEVDRDLSKKKYYAEDEQIDFGYILGGDEVIFATTDGCDPTISPDEKFGKAESLKAHFTVPEDGEYSFFVKYRGDASFKVRDTGLTKPDVSGILDFVDSMTAEPAKSEQAAGPKGLTQPEAYRMTFPDESGVSYIKMTPTGNGGTYECQSFEFTGRAIFTDENGQPFKSISGECDHASLAIDNSAATYFEGEIGYLSGGEKIKSAVHDPSSDPEPCEAWGLSCEFGETTEFTPYLESAETAYIKSVKLTINSAIYVSSGGGEADYFCETPLETADGLILNKTVTAQFSEKLTNNLKSGDKIGIIIDFGDTAGETGSDLNWQLSLCSLSELEPDGSPKVIDTRSSRDRSCDEEFEIPGDGDYIIKLTNYSESPLTVETADFELNSHSWADFLNQIQSVRPAIASED